MPPQPPMTAVATETAAAPPPALSPPPAEGASNGEVSHAAETIADASAPAEASEPSEVAAATDATGEKKKRRRRRKKRAGGQAGVDGLAAEAHEPGSDQGDAESVEEGTAGAGEGVDKDAGAAAPPGLGPSHRENNSHRDSNNKKRDRKHGPPRERPPVNAGDIVFAKILDITDDAIIVDIPGRAHAIFDRREMLLADDDEPAGRGGRETKADAPAEASPHEPAAAEALSPTADDAANVSTNDADSHTAPVASEPSVLDGVVGGVSAVVEPSSVAQVAQGEAPVSQEPAPVAPGDGVPPKEPKVPRVILEVGADFIGVVHNDGARGGLVVLTHHPNRAEKAKPMVEKAFQEKTTILGLVTGVIKGGIEVDVDGLRAFAPGSHVDLRMGADLSHLVAQRLPFFVTEYAKRGRDIVLSRKTIVEEEARKARTEALAKLKVGEELDGIVRSVVAFGAFVDVGGIEGLVPLQEMSHNRADGPSDVFKVGEPTRVQVIKVDDRGKVWLSRKATVPDPWQKVAQKYAQGTRHPAKVVRLQPFGAFVELEPGVDGLIHTQDLSVKRIELPDEVVKVGDAIEVVVAHIDPSQHKIALHPAPQGDEANEAPQRVAPHKPVKVRVVGIESGGLVVRVLGVTGRNARGYVTSAGTGTPRGTELRKAFHVGQDIDAKIVEVDPRRGEVKLSIKALSEEQERSAYQQYRQQLKAEARFTLADLIGKKR